MGLPCAAGALAGAVEVEFETSAEVRLPGESRVLSRHADGSVRWLLVELIAPPMAAGSALTGTLRPRGPKLTLSGALTVSPASGSTPLTVRNEHLTLRSSAAPGTLFELEGEVSGGLSAPAGFALETAAGVLTPQGAGELGVETQTELSVSLLRQDELVDAGGRPVARLSTRVTVWRGSSAVRVEHSLDLLRGSHAIESWDLVLPLAAPGVQSRIVDTDGSLETVSGDFDRRQVDQATLRRDGIDETGRLPGVVAFDGTLVGARNFWQLNPSALRRAGDTLHLELCPAVDGRREALDAGFGRTQELWIQVGPEADLRDPAAVALGLEAPLYLHADAAWYCGSEVLGPLAPALAGDHTELEELLAQSTDLLFWRRDLAPDWNYGLQHFGDFFDRANGVAYWGAQQQEYDPAWIILQQFMRTGDPDYLQPGLETAWHYADVDVSWYGGAFQHRATSNHVRSQMAKIVGATLRGRWESWGQYDGSVSNAFDWVAETYHSGFAAKVHKWILPEQSRGASGEEEIALLFCIVGLFEVNTIGESVVPQEGDTLYDLAVLFSQQPEMQALGYHDPDAQFADFFGFYGGDWDNFPSFHVDDLPVPQERHSGGHSLIQGVVLAHLLTGSPRLREVALSFGRHEVDEVAPWAIDAIVSNREYTSEYLQMRDLGWTVVDLLSVAELTEEMPGEEQLHADALSAAADCVATILETPVERYASSIQAGLVLEGLVHWDRRTAAPAARAYLHDLARTWAATQYDWAAHAFRYKSYGTTEAYRGMTGLVILGLCYSETLEHDPALYATLVDAWANLPASTSYAKAYSMTYRSTARTMAYVRNFPPPSP
ncbi:MAG: hypothetical protein H8E31_11175 [Planctomycetes bacterium]|nr:hypothetical protein [Planctomycetota bacterium]